MRSEHIHNIYALQKNCRIGDTKYAHNIGVIFKSTGGTIWCLDVHLVVGPHVGQIFGHHDLEYFPQSTATGFSKVVVTKVVSQKS